MTTLRDAAQQALEALEWHLDRGTWGADLEGRAASLRAALEQEQAEPVAWYYERDADKGLSFAPDRDPYKGWQPLYTAPPQRKPLTEEEINDLPLPPSYTATVRDFVRIVERAHGIKEEV